MTVGGREHGGRVEGSSSSGSESFPMDQVVPPATRPRFSWLRLGLGTLFGLALLLLAIRNVQLSQVIGTLSQADPLLLTAALASNLIMSFLKAVRWRLLFFPRQSKLRLSKFFSALLIGQTTNAVLPARLGEVARIYVIGETEGLSKILALCTVVIEKLLDSLMLLLFLAILLLLLPLPDWLGRSQVAAAIALGALLVAALWIAQNGDKPRRLAAALIRYLPPPVVQRMERPLQLVTDSLDVLGHEGIPLQLLGISLGIWIISTLTNFLTLKALGIEVPLWTSPLLLVVLQTGSSIPSSPGKIGVFHYLSILTLTWLGVDKSSALGYALVLHLLVYAPMITLGTLFIWKESYGLHAVTKAHPEVKSSQEA